MALKITENIIIDDIDEVISRMQELIGPETFDINSMMNFIENEKATKFYFDQKMQGRSEGDRAAVYLWLDTGYVSQRDRTIFISLVPNWKTEKGLDRYLKTIGTRLAQLIDREEDRYYVLNKYKDAIVNTGIMDKFGNDFLVLYRMNLSGKFSEYGNYKPEKLIRSKADFMSNEFTKDQAIRGISPISFIDEDVKGFCPSIEDFDLDTKDLCHMIEERRSRFPENLQSVSSVDITSKLRNELMMGLRMLQHDRSYVKLLYSAKSYCI